MQRRILIYGLFILLTGWLSLGQATTIHMSPDQALKIGTKIWYNEAGGTVSKLTSWNRGEKFASMGIGHFLWFPKHNNGSYKGSFAVLVKYMDDRSITVPFWLSGSPTPYCPWSTRTAFLAAQHDIRMTQLRRFLYDTIPIQVAFMLNRLKQALPKMLAAVPKNQRPEIRERFEDIAQSPNGMYVLMDYVNFKGIGTTTRRQYHYQGWGLLQVLQEMEYAPERMSDIQAFTWAANNVLTRRVINQPPNKHDERWLTGWRHRLMTYLS